MLLDRASIQGLHLEAADGPADAHRGAGGAVLRQPRAVDQVVRKALATGGSKANDAQDHGFMYGWSFQDLDGHIRGTSRVTRDECARS